MISDNRRIYAPAHVEFGRQARKAGLHAGNQVAEDLIGDGLVEGADVAIGPDIKFQ